jgi:hypothetical protein
MNNKYFEDHHVHMTLISIIIVIWVYPMTIAPMGPTSNGGLLGLIFLSFSVGLSWWAFTINIKQNFFRRIIQLPLVAVTSFLTIQDLYRQYISGWWLGF